MASETGRREAGAPDTSPSPSGPVGPDPAHAYIARMMGEAPPPHFAPILAPLVYACWLSLREERVRRKK